MTHVVLFFLYSYLADSQGVSVRPSDPDTMTISALYAAASTIQGGLKKKDTSKSYVTYVNEIKTDPLSVKRTDEVKRRASQL